MRILIYLLVLSSCLPQIISGRPRLQTAVVPIDYDTARLSRVVVAKAIDSPITLDGRLDEDAWATAQPASDFIQGGRSLNPGQKASDRTEVRFLYDREALYVAFTNFDDDITGLVASSLRRDFAPNLGDEIGITLSPLHDNRSGFFLSTNPAGARRDLQLSNDGQINQEWEGVWDVRVGTGPDHWIAEFVIPFKTMRFPESASQVWGVNMLRTTRRTNQQSTWAPLPLRYNLSKVSLAGTLTGLEGIQQGRNLNVKPYVRTGVVQAQDSDGLASDFDSNAGLDLKYGLTPSLTFDATYRTDFSQAEVDQNQVNLTRFPLFFPEKREFFLENAGIFNFGDKAASENLLPFFSRRIGLSSSGAPIPVVGGARVSGSVGKQEIGFLAMKTENDGRNASNNFIVGRVKRNLLQNSFVGAIFTNRDSVTAGDYNRVYGLDAAFQFRSRLDLGGYVLKSDSPRLDGEDDARRISVKWQDDILLFGADYEKVKRNFNPDVGFIRRDDMSHYAGDFSYIPRLRRSPLIRDLTFRANYDYYADTAGDIATRSNDFRLGMNFENNSSLNFDMNETFERLALEFTNYAIPPGDYEFRHYTLSYSSDRSRRIGGGLNYNWGGFWNGNRRSFGGDLTVRPNHHWQADLTYTRNDIEVPRGNFPTTLVGLRVFYGFNSRAFLNSFVQYSAETRQVTTNIRFNIIHRPLSDLYIVFNERRSTFGLGVLDRGLILKFTNLFQF